MKRSLWVTEMIFSYNKEECGDLRMRHGDVPSRGRVWIACAAAILFGLLASSHEASAQPLLLEKIKEAQNRVDGLELNHRITTIREAVPVARQLKGPGRKSAVRYVKHRALIRDVAVVGLNSKTGELKVFTFQETVLRERKKHSRVKSPQVIAHENSCELI